MGDSSHERDLVVVGSGAGGMTAAIAAALAGQSVIVLEKMPFYGGATAISGGGVWIPANAVLARAGVVDSLAKARTYMDLTVGDHVAPERKQRYLEAGPRLVDEFEQRTKWVRWTYMRGYPDYYPELPGGFGEGRSIEPELLEAEALGPDLALMAPPIAAMGYKGLVITASDFHDLNMVMRTWPGKRAAVRVLMRTLKGKFGGSTKLTAGRALTGRLRLALRDLDVPIWLSSPLLGLETEGAEGAEKVVGVRTERDGTPTAVRARKGVILAAGGFSRSQEMRDRFHRKPSRAEWTMAPEGQSGDAIELGLGLGAGLDLMDKVWGQPSTMLPTEDGDLRPQHLLAERSSPSTLVVDGSGQRYQNEALPYPDFVEGMYERHGGTEAIPSWMVFDQRAKNRYLVLRTLPRQPFPKHWIEGGYVKRAPTIDGLALQIGVPPEKLMATLRRYNQLAAAGHDDDFGKGDSAYDRYYGDPTLPNPCLHPIDQAPFYAIAVYPTETSTKGGLMVDEWARVLREDGSPIEGLHATGNTAAPVMGNTYTGPGATIGPAMVYGYVAAKYLAGAREI